MESRRFTRAAVLGGNALAPAAGAARGATAGAGAGTGAGEGRAGGGGAVAATGAGRAGGAGGAGAAAGAFCAGASSASSGLLLKEEATTGGSALYAVSAIARALDPRLIDFVLMRRLLVRTEPRRLGAALAVGLMEEELKFTEDRLAFPLLSSKPRSSTLSVIKSATGATSCKKERRQTQTNIL